MGSAANDHANRKRLRRKLEALGCHPDEIARILELKAREQRVRRRARGPRPLVSGLLTYPEAVWHAGARRRHPALSDTTLDLLIHEHRRSVGAGHGPLLWADKERT